jgi:hypothetical protein
MAELDPVHLGVGEQPVKQDYRISGAKLVVGKPDAIGRSPEMYRSFSHSSAECQGARYFAMRHCRSRNLASD